MISGTATSSFLPLISAHICRPGRLSGRRAHYAQTQTKAFAKQIQLWLPSVHQITGVVWKSSDGGQQMRRKCFWSKKMARAKRDGGERQSIPLPSTCVFGSRCMWMSADLGASEAFFFWQRTQVCDTSACSGPMRGKVCVVRHPKMRRVFFGIGRWVGGNSCMPDQLALMAIVKFFSPPQLFLYGPLKWADASILLPNVVLCSKEYICPTCYSSCLSLNSQMEDSKNNFIKSLFAL